MPAEIDNLSFMLGQLKTHLENQSGRIDTMMLDAKQDRDIAASERAAAAIERQQAGLQRSELKRDIGDIKDRLGKIEPSVKDFVRLREKVGVALLIGGGVLSGAAYLVWAGISAVGPAVVDWFRSILAKG